MKAEVRVTVTAGKEMVRKWQDSLEIRERLCFRLVNYETNREKLKETPFVKFYDMAAVFYVLLDRTDDGQMVMPVYNEQQERWKMPAEELFRYAKENTPRLYPPRLRTASEILREITEAGGESADALMLPDKVQQEKELFYVLSNSGCMNGAAVLFYKGELQRAASQLETDFAIIPSSVHEILLVPMNEETNIQELKELLHLVNMKEVSVEERLSENIYLYRRDRGYLEEAEG